MQKSSKFFLEQSKLLRQITPNSTKKKCKNQAVNNFYKTLKLNGKPILFKPTNFATAQKRLREINSSKMTGIDNPCGEVF